MKNRFLIIGFFSLISLLSYSQSDIITAPSSKEIDVKHENSRGYLSKQFEFGIPTDGTIALASDGEFFYVGRHNNGSITKLDLEGNQVGSNFSISQVNGYTTLAYDGRYFWGALQTTTIHKIDMQADPPVRIGTIVSPVKVTYCSYDKSADGGNGGLWVGSWDTDLVLLSLSGTELRRISASTHGLSGTIATVIDNVNPGGPYFWTISSVQNEPPIMRQLYYNTGVPTGESFNLFTEGFTEATNSGGGMIIMTDLVPGTSTLAVLIQNSKVLGFNLNSIAGESLDIGVSALDLKEYINATNISNYTVSGKVKNYGKEKITSFNISYQIGDDEIQSYEVTDINLVAGGLLSFSHPTTVEAITGSHTIKVWTSMPNGEEDMIPLNDKFEYSYIVYDDNIARPRTILLEGFTSSSCGPCVQGNANLKSVLDQNHGLYSLIKYQMNWPGSGDPYYTAEAGARCSFYGVSSVPHIHVDGSAYNNNTVSLRNADLVNLQNLPAFMELDVDYYVEGQTVYAKATISPSVDFSGSNLRLMMAVVEKRTTLNFASNGEKEFLQVMKKFIPNANGITIGELTADTPVEFERQWEFKGNYRKPNNASSPINHEIEHSVEDFGNLTIIAWVQNMQNRSIMQACNGVLTQATVNYKTVNEFGTISATIDGNPVNQGELFDVNVEVKFNALPDAEYEVKEWKLNGTIVNNNMTNELVTTLNRNLNVTVEFQTTHVDVYYAALNNEFGTITATANNIEIESGESIKRRSQLVFSVIPNEGYEVKEWRNNGIIISGYNYLNEYTIESLDADVNITVEFQTSHVLLNYSTVNEFGTLKATVNEIVYESGDQVKRRSRVIFTAAPNEGYKVKEWRNNGAIISGNTSNTYTITSINADVEVTVEFILNSGVEKQTLSGVQLYPNPFTKSLAISNIENIETVEITNILGQKVKEIKSFGKTSIFIDTNDLTEGVYFVTLMTTSGDKIVHRVVKQK